MLLILSLILVLVAGNSSVFAAEQNGNQLTSSESMSIKQKMKEDGASQDDIDNVIKKLESGKILDSQKAMMEEETAFFSKEDIERASLGIEEELEKVVEFDDGSYIKLGIEVEDEPELISNALAASNGTFKTIKVKGSNPFADASFKARVFLNTHTGNNYIDKVYEPYTHTYLGTYSERTLKITRKYEDRKKKITAKSYLRFKYTNFSNLSSRDFYLKMHTGDKLQDRYGIWVSYTNGKASYQ